MPSIRYIDRKTRRVEEEKIYGGKALKWVYNQGLFSGFCRYLISNMHWLSKLMGVWQRFPFTRHRIAGFVEELQIDSSEFKKSVTDFTSFADFFERELRIGARVIEGDACMPADGRYLFYQEIDQGLEFDAKGIKFDLRHFLQDEALADNYTGGTMVIARLCPTDYHRFHFPCSGIPETPRAIEGALYSVNPLALQWNRQIYAENKRIVTLLRSDSFGDVTIVEVGATFVGSIHNTFRPGLHVNAGDEMGYFSFGGSLLVLLFEKETLRLQGDLVNQGGLEIRCLMGQSLGQTATY